MKYSDFSLLFKKKRIFYAPTPPPSPPKEGHIALHMLVGICQTTATYIWRMLNPIDFKYDTLININMKIIPITRQVSGSR